MKILVTVPMDDKERAIIEAAATRGGVYICRGE